MLKNINDSPYNVSFALHVHDAEGVYLYVGDTTILKFNNFEQIDDFISDIRTCQIEIMETDPDEEGELWEEGYCIDTL